MPSRADHVEGKVLREVLPDKQMYYYVVGLRDLLTRFYGKEVVVTVKERDDEEGVAV